MAERDPFRQPGTAGQRRGNPHVLLGQIDSDHIHVIVSGQVTGRSAQSAARVEHAQPPTQAKLVYQGNGARSAAAVELIDRSQLFGFQMLRIGSHRRESVKDLLFPRPMRVVLRDGRPRSSRHPSAPT